MILKKAVIANYRGINSSVAVNFDSFNCIVGQNDAGKSTILKAIDCVLNENNPTRNDYNVNSQENCISIELFFDCKNEKFLLGEEIETTFEAEELVNEDNLLVWKKTWNVTDSNILKPKTYIVRKKYKDSDDFLLKTENQLISHCREKNIDTSKGNGENYNNVEKREKLRKFNQDNLIEFEFDYEEILTSGNSKIKIIGDCIKKALPSFQYYKADSSLSETDSTIQKYFKEMAFEIIESKVDTNEIEDTIKSQLGTILQSISDKINEVVDSTEKVEPRIEFDWSKLISTSFVSTFNGNNIPLSSRGDGFRRITMMSYFEYLAQSNKKNDRQNIIFGFEEPETFLHPTAQLNLYEKLKNLSENGYQVLISTHSPVIVGNVDKEGIIHISKYQQNYILIQTNIDYRELANDLGIKPDKFSHLFSTSKFLFLVEGVDDAKAMHHNAKLYKENSLIDNTFDELNINIIPIGGCDAIKHWVNLDLLTKLGKPYFIFLDSDKATALEESKNEKKLLSHGFVKGKDFVITKKRLLENYIAPIALQRLVPGCSITYNDFDHAKNICKDYPDETIKRKLGGQKVVERQYANLTFNELRLTWYDGEEDEFLNIYKMIISKLQAS
ncbi:AAA family ATPase [Moraxella osloensis]|jgi:putative ATP-dependent endonuclease of the OLD family|nr:AAA family ATPase [Moraxella osloensis]MBW4015560.1 AAA family ATPase [Moraxella osloensis]BAV11908.1 ATP-dependent OLD family endonuclease [Moraxella osloensis]